MNDKDFIKEFKKISVKSICNEQKVNYYNVMSGRAGYDATRKVAKAIADKLCSLLNERNEFMAVNFEDNGKNKNI